MLSVEGEVGGWQRRKENDLHGARDMLCLVADPQLSHLVVSCCQHLATVCTHTHTGGTHNTLTQVEHITHTSKGATANSSSCTSLFTD